MGTPSTDRGNAIETAAMPDRRRHGSFAVTRGGHVGHGDAQAIGSKTPRRAVEPTEIPSTDRHDSAFSEQQAGGREPDAGRSTTDQEALRGDGEIHDPIIADSLQL